MAYLGYAAAALIATGVIIPLGVDPASLSNFVGYIAWCLWLLTLAVVLWRAPTTDPTTTTPPGATQTEARVGAANEPPPIGVEG